eukprot:760340-Hanusia_phi.AAC.5
MDENARVRVNSENPPRTNRSVWKSKKRFDASPMCSRGGERPDLNFPQRTVEVAKKNIQSLVSVAGAAKDKVLVGAEKVIPPPPPPPPPPPEGWPAGNRDHLHTG